jgi:SAM-dependent methyltransferase
MYPVWLNYALETNLRGQQLLGRIQRLMRVSDTRHLDIGCAFGGTCIAFARAGAESVGIDLDLKFLELACANLADHPTIKVQLLQRDISKWEEVGELGTFDVITCDNVIEHVLDVHQTLLNIARLLKPDGLCHMAIPNSRSVAEISSDGHFGKFGISLLGRDQAEAYYHAAEFPGNYDVGYYFTIPHYKRMFAAAGLSFDVLNGTNPAQEEISFLANMVQNLTSLFEQEIRLDRIPSVSIEPVREALDAHLTEFRAAYNRYIQADKASKPGHAGELAQDYQEGLWFVVARRYP